MVGEGVPSRQGLQGMGGGSWTGLKLRLHSHTFYLGGLLIWRDVGMKMKGMSPYGLSLTWKCHPN